jgi:hypothetical protein
MFLGLWFSSFSGHPSIDFVKKILKKPIDSLLPLIYNNNVIIMDSNPIINEDFRNRKNFPKEGDF